MKKRQISGDRVTVANKLSYFRLELLFSPLLFLVPFKRKCGAIFRRFSNFAVIKCRLAMCTNILIHETKTNAHIHTYCATSRKWKITSCYLDTFCEAFDAVVCYCHHCKMDCNPSVLPRFFSILEN